MKYDAIAIPGGGVRSGGVLPHWVAPRFDRALRLAGDACLMPLSAGTPHRAPPLDENGFPWTEARAGARYLVERGADPRRILLEESSYDTIGNAYFSRVLHVIPRGFERLLVVTSQFHMQRTENIFRWVYGLEGPGARCVVEFETVPDDGIDAAALAARRERERASLTSVLSLQDGIRTLAELHGFLFTVHEAYSCGRRSAPVADPPLY